MNVVQEIKRINEQELAQGLSGKASWHHEYKDSAWVFAGGFSYDLTEGDVLCVMSQWGEIEDINLCRENDTGKSKGFCFIKYEDQKSTILAVDNFNGIQLLGRTIRVDHKHKYSLPKDVREREEKLDEERIARGEAPKGMEAQWRPGVAYEGKQLASAHNFHKGVDVFAAPVKGAGSSDDNEVEDGGFPASGSQDGLSASEKGIRKEAKKARKQARKEKRKHKKPKDKKKDEDSRDHRNGDRKKRKVHKQDGGDVDNSFAKRRRGGDDNDNDNRANEDSRVDAARMWERGVRAPAHAGSGDAYASGSTSRAEAPPSLSVGNVLDWRGLGGRGGGRGGRGGRGEGRGRGARDGGRGRGGGLDERGGAANSFGGMNRRR